MCISPLLLGVITNVFGQSSDALGADNCTSCVVMCAIVAFLVSFLSLFAIRGAQRLKAKKKVVQHYEFRYNGMTMLKYGTLLCAVVTAIGALFVFNETGHLLSIFLASFLGGVLGWLLASHLRIGGTIDPIDSKAN